LAELEMAALPDSSAAIEPRLRVREGMRSRTLQRAARLTKGEYQALTLWG
jgi:hypothetical protein